MTRIHLIVEGQTEESFVKNLLAPTFWPRDININPIILGPPGHRGGNPKYARLKKDVIRQLKQDRSAYCSMLLDFYGLGTDFPGMPLPCNLSNLDKVLRIEESVKNDILSEEPGLRADIRFIPYLQLHEYEGLLFSEPTTFARAIRQVQISAQFQAIRNAFPSPEDINDGRTTAPSKRIISVYPGYRKVLDGTLGAQAVGIERMRDECPHFRNWLERLEALAE